MLSKEEYQTRKAQIIAEHGEPEWDMNAPVNESARLLTQLRAQRSIVAKSKAQKEARLKVEREIEERLTASAIPELDINKDLLSSFTPDEQKIITQYFKNVRQTPKDIANAVDKPYQKVSTLLNSDAFKLLRRKVMQDVDDSIKIESLLTFREMIRSGRIDKTTLDMMAKNLNKASFNDTEVSTHNGSTPLYDADVQETLKRLGEEIVHKKQV